MNWMQFSTPISGGWWSQSAKSKWIAMGFYRTPQVFLRLRSRVASPYRRLPRPRAFLSVSNCWDLTGVSRSCSSWLTLLSRPRRSEDLRRVHLPLRVDRLGANASIARWIDSHFEPLYQSRD